MPSRRISDSEKRATTIKIPASLRAGVDTMLHELREIGDNAAMTDLFQTGLFLLLLRDAEDVSGEIRRYRRAPESDLPRMVGKVIPFRRAGRPRSQSS